MATNSHPHPLPPPTPVPRPPSPDDHPTVIVIVVISFGCIFLLGLFLFSLWCLHRRYKCQKKKLVRKTEDIDVDEHLKVQEMVLPGPHGPKTVVLAVEDDLHVHEDMKKCEIDMVGKELQATKAVEGKSVDNAGSSQQPSHPENRV